MVFHFRTLVNHLYFADVSFVIENSWWTYTWNAENKLIRAASSSGKVTNYGYYDDGNLAYRQDINGKVVYIYDGIHCIAEYDESNALLKEYVYGPNVDEVLCAQTPAGGVAYYHQDALQSVTALTDGFANKVVSYEYDVYGALTKTVGTIDNQILFTGRWLDSDTNLYYYRARWYDSEAGRFVSRDPIGVMGGVNLYGYCLNNSIKFNDPKGLCGIPILPPKMPDVVNPNWGEGINNRNMHESGYIMCYLASSEIVFDEDACMKFKCIYECEDGSIVQIGHVSECEAIHFLPYTPID
ncbi:MAG: RHS repeat-associated core domain-containing protein [Candidatus Omnitrophica bacterium]|nr:RHS repeat-associated core domain-containing protein [Candidatus Omnitrophota bacterium]